MAEAARHDWEPGEVAALVRRHRVRFAVYPAWALGPGLHLRQVGFAIELTGEHVDPRHQPEPGCDECGRVYAVLERIATFAMPREHRPTNYLVEPRRPALSYSPKRHGASEVTLTVRIVHREHYCEPVDACERQCRAEMSRRLVELGAIRDGP
ncbi:MAG: hypothetical protein IT373_00750 [Polyangiaceae bacterium]|nr:hypothetical protein [Polyangiaceae bacterium]